jgi:hypothetical protein
VKYLKATILDLMDVTYQNYLRDAQEMYGSFLSR